MSGISIPYEVLNTEFTTNDLLLKQPIIGFNIEWLLSTRIFLKIIKAFLVNILSFIIILSAGGLIADIKNYLALMIPVFIGTIFIACIGYLISSVLLFLNTKRELIAIIQAIFIGIFISSHGEDNYFLPFGIIRNKISGILMSDIVFYELGVHSTISALWYWTIIFLVSVLLVIMISYFTNILFHKKTYKA
ncbi:hypothetical protein [Clostridium sp. Marseille-P2415]|uniref:hypothetical protein n=1 Tax=Clostridium sp. Marseille-P2415 TaxID=1805471 RepID=UPI0013566DD0|nr:hypothetical protein [Clostridium sp. Marseille-P2415]